MKSYAVVIVTLSMLLNLNGCAHRRGCHEQDITPSHTFGKGGIYERKGRLLPPRQHCPMCEYLGMKCPKCRVACDTPVDPPSDRRLASSEGRKPESEVEQLLNLLKTNPVKTEPTPARPSAEAVPIDDHDDRTRPTPDRVWTPYSPVRSLTPVPPWEQ